MLRFIILPGAFVLYAYVTAVLGEMLLDCTIARAYKDYSLLANLNLTLDLILEYLTFTTAGELDIKVFPWFLCNLFCQVNRGY